MLEARPAVMSRSAAVLAAVAAIFALALALRLYGIGDKSIWLDEAWSWRSAKLSLPDMVEWTGQDKHPPLYYAVLHAWVSVFGDAEWSLRAPSAIAGALSVALIAAVGWRGGGSMLAVLAGLLFAVHPTAIEFSQEARMYPLAGLLALAASIALAATIERPQPWRFALYAVLATALVYTHYSGFFVLALHAALIAIYGLRALRSSDGSRLLLGGGIVLTAVAIAYIPWYGHLLDSARDGVDHLPATSWTLVDLVFSSQLGLQRAEDFWLAIALPLVGFGIWGVVKRAANPYVVCVATLAVVPIVQLTYSWLRTPVLDPRQASPYIAGVVLVMALGIIEAGEYVAGTLSRRRVALPVAAACMAALGVLLFVASTDWYGRGPREDWRGAAAEIDGVDGSVFIWRGYIDVPLSYYTDHRLQALSANDEFKVTIVEARQNAIVLSHESSEERNKILAGPRELVSVSELVEFEGIVIYILPPLIGNIDGDPPREASRTD